VTSNEDRPTETVYQSGQLDVRAAEALVRGQLQRLEWVGRPAVVLAIPYTRDGRLVLVRQYRSATDGYTLEFPAGKIHPDEGPHQALERELREEAGYRIDTASHVGNLLTAPHFSDEAIHVYRTSGEIVSRPQPTPQEQLTVELVPPTDIEGLIYSGELTDAKSLAALFIHQQKEGRREH
jgi:ADP-ribose pyrophosphatase